MTSCEDHGGPENLGDAALDPVLAGHSHHGARAAHPAHGGESPSTRAGILPRRRSVLKAGAGGVAAALFGGLFTGVGPTRAAVSQSPLSDQLVTRAALHVHGSASEQQASWESQCVQAAAAGFDWVNWTDHDHRGLASGYLTSLAKQRMVATTSGALRQQTTSNTNGMVRTLAESSSSEPAALTATVPPSQTLNQLRTYIGGQSLALTFGRVSINRAGMYELVIPLSNHPAYGDHPAGQYSIRYRFGSFQHGRAVDPTGLTGIVTAPAPVSGSTLTLTIEDDVAAIWPDLIASDNTFGGLSLVATSPDQGAVVDVSVSVRFVRTKNDAASLTAWQQSLSQTYGQRHPGLLMTPATEFSAVDTHHLIPVGASQYWPDQSQFTPANQDAAYRAAVDHTHANGGVVSWAHAYGSNDGAYLSAADQTTKRRQVFAAMMALGHYGCDLLEVFYCDRGNVGVQAHLDLWDTFSRHGIFLTGNGVNDDHFGLDWSILGNGYGTGVLSASTAPSQLVASLKAGRAFIYHPGNFPGAHLDTLLDDGVPMGGVSLSSAATRKLSIFASGLPSNSYVQVVQGAVDYTGNDPGTSIVATIPGTRFAGAGVVSTTLTTPVSSFFRVQVVDPGLEAPLQLIGGGNPTWSLRKPPPDGIPSPRLAPWA